MTRLNLPLYVALAASILTAVPANGSRDTLPHQRMIRRRGPGPIEPKVAAFDHGLYVRQDTASASAPGGTPTSVGATTATASSTTVATTSSPTSSPVSTSTQPSSTVVSTTSGGLLNSLTNLLSTSSTIASTSTTPSTTSVAPSTSAAPTSIAPSTTAAAPPAVTPTLNIATSSPTSSRASATNLVVTSTLPPTEEASQSAAAAKKAKITQNTIISLVVIAACIGGAIAIWTVIRKWKLSPSEKFDDRMQPIDWAPQGAGGNDETMEEKRHRRAGSSGSHGSFTSAGAGKSESGHANGMYNDSQHGHGYGAQGQDFPPAHDFTAGAAQPGYGQYYGGQQYAGGAGYADLQRGPSVSESTYSHGASVTRGLSYSRGPTAGYEAQPGAAGLPPLPNPYGGEYGYDDYAPQAGQPQAQAHQAQVPYRGY